jgi:hypothetical protein
MDNSSSTKDRTITALIVAVVILLLALGGLVGYLVLNNASTERPSPTPTTAIPVSSPTATSAPSVSPTSSMTTLCQASQLTGTLTLSPGAGNVYGTITLTNTSQKACAIPGDQFDKLLYDKTTVKNLAVVYQGMTSTSPFILSPHDAVYATIHYPNGPQCSSQTVPINVSMTYTISPGNSINITSSPNTIPFTIQTCQSESELTTVEVSSFSTNKRP